MLLRKLRYERKKIEIKKLSYIGFWSEQVEINPKLKGM